MAKIRKHAFVKVKDAEEFHPSTRGGRYKDLFGRVLKVKQRYHNELLFYESNIWLPVKFIKKIVIKEENPEYFL